MTQEEFATRKFKIYLIAGIGIAAFIGSSLVGYVAPNRGQLAILLTAIFFGCIFVATRMAYRLKKEAASR
jgi:hypothetical protein